MNHTWKTNLSRAPFHIALAFPLPSSLQCLAGVAAGGRYFLLGKVSSKATVCSLTFTITAGQLFDFFHFPCDIVPKMGKGTVSISRKRIPKGFTDVRWITTQEFGARVFGSLGENRRDWLLSIQVENCHHIHRRTTGKSDGNWRKKIQKRYSTQYCWWKRWDLFFRAIQHPY